MSKLGLAFAFASLAVAPVATAGQNLNQTVLDYSIAHEGQQVGNGQCWTLAYDALKAAGAHLPGSDGFGSYEFGTVVDASEAQPGDVIQFEGARFEAPNGSWQEMSHHTAVVEQTGNGRVFKVLHQNVNGVMRVQEGSFDLEQKTQGTVTFFRPEPR